MTDTDLNQLLHPAHAFSHPNEVLEDPDLTLNEKRTILASWASDACAVEATPALRVGSIAPVPFDDIRDALRQLDREARRSLDTIKRAQRRQRFGGLRRPRPPAVRLRTPRRRGPGGPRRSARAPPARPSPG